jgi:hypothetical protein
VNGVYSKSNKKLGKKKVHWIEMRNVKKLSMKLKMLLQKMWPWPMLIFQRIMNFTLTALLVRLELSSLRTTGLWRFGVEN